jgi:cysteine-rich repeat protein
MVATSAGGALLAGGAGTPAGGGSTAKPSSGASGWQGPTTLSAPLGGSPRTTPASAGAGPANQPPIDAVADAQPAGGGEHAPAAAKPVEGRAAVCGDGRAEADEQCDDGNTRNGDGCSSTCLRELKAVTVTPSRLDALRISGSMNLPPIGKATKEAMQQNGVTTLRGTVKLCVNTSGLVADSMLVERSGYAEYDSKLLSLVHEWRFRPYLLDGAPVPVCSTQEFVYVAQAK